MPAAITFDRFPTSPLALRTNNPADQARRRAFSCQMARAATTARDHLADLLATTTGTEDRVAALIAVHTSVTDWRYEAAARATGRLGQGIAYDPARFRTPIAAAGTNYDRLGPAGRLRDGSTWHPATRTYRGGTDTPASRALAHYGSVAQRRFAREAPTADILQNRVTLPDGRTIPGNRLLRGQAAHHAATELTTRTAARGLPTTHIETGGHPLYTATPDPADATLLRAEALRILAGPGLTPQLFLTARYLLFQAPVTKKGSDAVTRVFTVAVADLLLGTDAPALPADIDLRCYVLGQQAATRP
ncbi:hypothetical protein [Kitasatospora sp. MY 5-36]|uniref:hypothetical protein n=1 Tax=Kitasatospora sp. MY 5-36 TaxID=1678027 RepID=UPI00067106A4|nr:hypothetical protein [Kitasatospora sp. MY 5-36]